LEQLYGSDQSLTLAEAAEGGGTLAQVTIPFRSRAELRTTLVASEAGR